MSILDSIKGMFGGKSSCCGGTKEGCCKNKEADEIKSEASIVETPAAPIVEVPKTENPFTQAPPTEAPKSETPRQ